MTVEFVARSSNACAPLSRDEYGQVVAAANEYVAAHGALMGLMDTVGSKIEGLVDRMPEGVRSDIFERVRAALDYAQQVATYGMDQAAGQEPSRGLYLAVGTASGAVSGFFGLPAVLAELPFATLTILRAIADVARSKGADLREVDVQARCLEVFAYGAPIDEDDDTDVAFYASRIGAPALAEVIAKVAVKYTAVLLPKAAVLSVPVAGSVLGAGLNWSYMRFYQSVAGALFTLRPVELKHDSDQVRSCFGSIVAEIRAGKNGRRQRGVK